MSELREYSELLESLFTGDLAHLKDVLILGSKQPGTVSLEDVLVPDVQAAIVEAFSLRHGITPPIAVLSIWSKWYFATVLPPLITSNVMLGRMPPFAQQHIRLILADDYTIRHVAIADGKPVASKIGSSARLGTIIEHLVAPSIELFHARTDLSRSVLWSNAGNLIEGVIRHLERIAAPHDAVHECDTYLAAPRVGGRRNRLHRPVVYQSIGSERVRRRRVCCLRYMLPDAKLCCACPRHELIDRPEHRAGEDSLS